MKILSISLLLGMISLQASEETITLPSQEEIARRLESLGLDHFDDKTKLSSDLGSQKKYPLGVVNAVNLAAYSYNELLKKDCLFSAVVTFSMNKTLIVPELLKEYPAIVAALKQQGVIQ